MLLGHKNRNASLSHDSQREIALVWALSRLGVRQKSGEGVVRRNGCPKGCFWRVRFFSAPLRFSDVLRATLKGAEKKWTLQKHPFGQPFLRTTPSPLLWCTLKDPFLTTNREKWGRITGLCFAGLVFFTFHRPHRRANRIHIRIAAKSRDTMPLRPQTCVPLCVVMD